jgi:hypothetical protein
VLLTVEYTGNCTTSGSTEVDTRDLTFRLTVTDGYKTLHTAAPTAVRQRVLESDTKEKSIKYKLSERRQEMCLQM